MRITGQRRMMLKELLGLLTNEQYDNFLNTEMNYLADSDRRANKLDMRESLISLSEQIRDAYLLFLSYLSSALSAPNTEDVED